MKESYFIDNVDLEWCFRAKSLGFDLVGTDAAVLYHAIGERSSNPLVRGGVDRTAQSLAYRITRVGIEYICTARRLLSRWGGSLRDMIRFILKASLALADLWAKRREYFQEYSLRHA